MGETGKQMEKVKERGREKKLAKGTKHLDMSKFLVKNK